MAKRAGRTSLERVANDAERRMRGVSVERPVPINNHYEVDEVLQARVGKNGTTEYLVSWAGYPSSNDSWIGVLPEFFKKTWETPPVPRDDVNELIKTAIALLSLAVSH